LSISNNIHDIFRASGQPTAAKEKKKSGLQSTQTPSPFFYETKLLKKYGVEKGTRIIPCRWHSRGFSGGSRGGAAAARKRREQHRRCWHAAVQP
jgi:hypothetical protein